MGKTAFVLNMARNMAVDHNIPVAFFSLEMSAISLVKRLMVSETGLSSDKIRGGRKLSDEDWGILNRKITAISKSPLWIDDTPSLSIYEFRSKARRLVRNSGVKIIILDYLQLMTGPPELKGLREQEVAAISRSLKTIAKELSVPIIAIAQLSRRVETRGGSMRPQLSDLRESGAIEQDADLVLFIHRPSYYGLEDANKEDAQIIIAKHRNGSVGDINMQFVESEVKFIDNGSGDSGDNYTMTGSSMNDGVPFDDGFPGGTGFDT
jgi:replicative DNA helicase